MRTLILLPLVVAAAGPMAGCGTEATATADTLYCYRTLAKVDCYVEPVPQDRRQLVGHIGPPPPPPLPPATPLTIVPAPKSEDISALWDGDQLSR
jgi:hypothetical protein